MFTWKLKRTIFIVYSKVLLVVYVHMGLRRKSMKRAESVALLEELGANQLVSPVVVSLEQILPGIYRLKIKGDYDLQAMKLFLRNRFSVEENKDYLVISTPDQ
jgi:hypothetical protein